MVIGISNLRKYLKENKDQWVKISMTRGDMETFHSKNYTNIEPRLDELEYKLGAKKNIMQFCVEAALNNKVETGMDFYTIDGRYPDKAMMGIEIKDEGYVAVIKDYDDMPMCVRGFNSGVSGILKKYNYRGFASTEIRVGKDQVPYMIDYCARQGSPPSELYQNMYTNLADIFWNGADGIMVNPELATENGEEVRHGVEILLHSGWADKNWQPIEFPEEIRDNVKFRNLTMFDGKYYVVPQSQGLPEIGAVVAMGTTRESAIERAKEYCEQVQGYYIEAKTDSLDKAQEEIDKLAEYGIEL
jgi:hypothetical protein